MTQYSSIEVAQIMEESGVVPLFYHPNVEIGEKYFKLVIVAGLEL